VLRSQPPFQILIPSRQLIIGSQRVPEGDLDEQFTLAAVRQAAQRGRLDAVQGADGIWRSSRKALDAYRVAKHQRRRNTARSG
jgi:hypothetical protein